jgi:hypothetical protein
VPALAALGVFVLWTPPARWAQPELLAALAAIAAVAFFAEVRLKVAAAAYFDATIVLALLALALAGPLPALCVWLVPDAISRLVIRRDRVLSPGMVATISSFALALLAGEALLQLAAAPSMAAAAPVLYTTGLVMWLINFVFARLTFAPFYQGYRPGPLARAEFLDLMPMVMAMLAIGIATAVLIPPLGVLALAPLALVVVVPQLALAVLVRGRSVADLTCLEATQLYAAAISDVLGLPKRERRIIACTAELLTEQSGDLADGSAAWSVEVVPDVVMAALHANERWDATGWPAGLPGSHAPLASRVLAVARAWSEMTAAETPKFPHAEAILGLSARSGAEFDPQIVQAAAQVVAEEQAFVRDPGFQPRLHRLPLPRSVRRSRMPAVLARLGEPATTGSYRVAQ